MRGVFSGILIATMTFLVGASASRLIDKLSSAPTYAYNVFVAPVMPRFNRTMRACGPGYIQGYETNHGESLSEGVSVFDSRQDARRVFQEEKRNALRVIERRSNVQERLLGLSERVVLETNDVGNVTIMWYGGDVMIRYIDAPSLDLALELEQYISELEFRMPVD